MSFIFSKGKSLRTLGDLGSSNFPKTNQFQTIGDAIIFKTVCGNSNILILFYSLIQKGWLQR